MAPYSSRDIAVVVPTFNRPEKLSNLLASLAAQSERVGRVVVVDGAENAKAVTEAFASRLNAEYHRCQPPGQIRQRNLGLRHLRESDRLVALFDDDIVLLPGAIAAMVRFWNTASPPAAAVAFNIVNGEPEHYSALRELFGLTAREPGRVLRSGMTTPLSHMDRSARVQWVPGGATVWRSDLLREHAHREIQARWAIAEDLLFSYRLGKREALYVCAEAQCRHEHVFDYNVQRRDRYHGRTQTLWMYHFVASNADLSRAGFFWTLLVRMAGKFARGVVRGDRSSVEFVLGQAGAATAILTNAFSGADFTKLLEETR